MLAKKTYSQLGSVLIDRLSVSERSLNLIFAALILTTLSVFFCGNLLLLNQMVFWHSLAIVLICLGFVATFYALARKLSSLPWALVLSILAIIVCVYARLAAITCVAYFAMTMAAVYTTLKLRLEWRDWLYALLMGLLAAAVILGVSGAYTTFDMLPRLYLGDVHQDTLYHASIGAMIKNYGVISTGLHGLVNTPYHALSHAIIAGLSLLSGVGVLEVYGVAPWVLFAPLLLFSITAFCAILDRDERLTLPLVWVISTLLLAFLPYIFARWALWDSFFGSESYLLSLIIFVLCMSLLYKRRLTIVDLLLIAVAASLIANAKASVGVIYAGLWFTRLLMVSDQSKSRVFYALLLALAAIFIFEFSAAEARSSYIKFGLLSFVREFCEGREYLELSVAALLNHEVVTEKVLALGIGAVVGYIVFHYIVSWVVIGIIAHQKDRKNLLNIPIVAYSLAAIAAGTVIGFAVDIPAGAIYYFSNVALFVSLPVLAANLAGALQHYRVNNYLVFVLAIVVIIVNSLNAYRAHSFLSPDRATYPQDNLTVTALLNFRERLPLNFILRPSLDLLANNPIKPCTAQPFIFPAVSERPWIDVIKNPEGCPYRYFGYGQYGITKENPKINIEPRIIKNMEILNLPESLDLYKNFIRE